MSSHSYDTWKTTETRTEDPELRLEAWGDSCEQARVCAALEVRYQHTRLLWLDEDVGRKTWRPGSDDHALIDQMTDGYWSQCPAHVRQLLQSLWAEKCRTW